MVAHPGWAANLLSTLFPELFVNTVARASGQRVVLFCNIPDKKSRLRAENKCSPNVVVKLTTNISHSTVAYYEREVEFLSSTKSPCFPRLFYHALITEDPVTENPLPQKVFITIEECVQGGTLAERAGTLSDEHSVLMFLTDIVNALTPLWMHSRRFVHRDLKPDNIMIRDDGGITIIDLDIVRETGADGVTVSASPFGPLTPRYASPEQITNQKREISFKSDFFSLGIIAYELLAKNHPLLDGTEANMEEIFTKMLKNEAPKLSAIAPVSEKFSLVISQLIEKKPYKRQRTVDVLQSQLADCL
jgi:serine/threonine-protein kinase